MAIRSSNRSSNAFQNEIDRVTRLLGSTVVPAVMTKAQQAADYLGRAGVNASKDSRRIDTWKDQTGNLRKSISHVVRETGSGLGRMRTVVTVFAGMEYGIQVHFRRGYRVLVPPPQDAVNRIQKQMAADRSFRIGSKVR